MSLATRCTACGTVFRVVQDQLKVSEGWVRCGRCDEVFNALEGLFDLEREAPPAGPLAAASSAPKPAGAQVAGAGHDGGGEAAAEWGGDPRLPAQDEAVDTLLLSRPDDTGLAVPPFAMAPDDPREFASARWDAELLTDEAALLAEPELAHDPADGGPRAESQRTPEFLRQAEHQARWQRPQVRALLGVAALALLGALALQAVHHFRDTVAVRWPQTHGALQAWCAALQCTLAPPRRINDISVESTTLARAGTPPEAFRLSVNLRNHGALPLSVPSVDLKLTDGSGALIARRMLSPSDFRVSVAALPPGSETMLQMLMSTGNRVVAGYTVEVFYP